MRSALRFRCSADSSVVRRQGLCNIYFDSFWSGKVIVGQGTAVQGVSNPCLANATQLSSVAPPPPPLGVVEQYIERGGSNGGLIAAVVLLPLLFLVAGMGCGAVLDRRRTARAAAHKEQRQPLMLSDVRLADGGDATRQAGLARVAAAGTGWD